MVVVESSNRGPLLRWLRLGLVLALGLSLPAFAAPQGAGQEKKKGDGGEEQQTVDEFCEGFTFFTLKKDGTKTPGPLRCNGTCPDGKTKCSPQSNKDKSRTWCGCPDLPEPEFCHLVELRVKPKRGAPFTSFACEGPCPGGPQDICRPRERQADPEEPGGDKRIVVTCECLGVGAG